MSSIRHLIHGLVRDVGFPVRRLLPAAAARTVGPFVFFDHMGPVEFDSNTTAGDVRPHPHIGLATVTYLFSGAMMHRDSLGVVQRITPGAVNWMTAGAGIVHSERIPEDIRAARVAVHGLQMWVALPQAEEQGAAGFHHYPENDMPYIELAGASLHLLAGNAFGHSSPVRTSSPTLYVCGRLQAGASLNLPADYRERALYVVSGNATVDGEVLDAGVLAVLEEGAPVLLTAQSDTLFMLLGGEPIDGPRFVWWNFVASSKELIESAKLAWRAQDRSKFGAIPGEVEWIPLPEH
jgi:redox-sensitive bicupin YhaK (pirin superfamily)